MFLTKKSLLKTLALCIAYACVGIIGIGLGVLLAVFDGEALLLVVGIICLAFSPLLFWCDAYSKGTAKLVNAGKKLVFSELRPAAFIEKYQNARNDPDNVVSKPSFDVLTLVISAYNAMGEPERALEVIEEMLTIMPEKKKTLASLLKVSFLFDMGRTEEAEALLAEAQTKKMNYQAQAVTDAIYKCDRAKAIGDYQAVENYMKQRLLTTFPKPTNLALLYAHFELAEIYVKTGRPGDAKAHYEYCAANGGQTVIRKKSEEQLKAPELSQTDTAEINYEQY